MLAGALGTELAVSLALTERELGFGLRSFGPNVGYDTARRHYIHNNPYLRKAKHRRYEEKADSHNEIERIPLEILEDGMSKKLKLSTKWIEQFEKQYLQMVLVDDEETPVVSYTLTCARSSADRAAASGAVGQRFESSRARQDEISYPYPPFDRREI